MTSIERLVPLPAMLADSAAVFSEIRASGHPSLALRHAVREGKVTASDLPEIIANIWTWDDSPTSDLGEADGWGHSAPPSLRTRGRQGGLARSH
jgi:hypothetical protein